MTDITSFLERLGLSGYAESFVTNEIETSDLPELTDEDLRFLGLPLGPRRRLLKATREMQQAPVESAQRPDATGLQEKRTIVAERRQLTVMFIDLVASTALSQDLDPEDLVDVMRLFNETCAQTVRDHNGYVANHLGDGLMVLFGFPRANEGEVERAIRAGLSVIRNVEAIRTHSKLAVRVGIATGLVVVGELTGAQSPSDFTAMGKAVNLAARLQSLADPGTLIVASSSRRLSGNVFQFSEKGAIKLKGFSEPVSAWQVIGKREHLSRFRASEQAALHPLIGRSKEYVTLSEKWRRSLDGEGQVVLVSGEPGIGKSRIVEELLRSSGHDNCKHVFFQCSQYHVSSTLHPVIRYLERDADFRPEDSEEERLRKLTSVLAGARQSELKSVASIMSLPFEDLVGELDLTPQQMLEQVFSIIQQTLLNDAHHKPLLLVIEDAHWADPTTKSLLDEIVGEISGLPALVIVTFRSGFDPGWVLRSNLTHMRLAPLEFTQVEEIATAVARGKRLPAEIYELIAARTNGVPLYIEEVTKDILEAGFIEEHANALVLNSDLPALKVPSTLQDFLTSRLDRLGDAREVAQIGSVFGISFSLASLALIAQRDEAELSRLVSRLTDAGIVFHTHANGDEVLTFKHALVRDTAYNSLLKRERQTLHDRIATEMSVGMDKNVTGPEIIAHHYTIAQRPEKAFGFWLDAGRRAIERSANSEGSHQLTMAADQLLKCPRSPDRDATEIEILVLKAGVLRSTAGIAADETGSIYKRIRELCASTGDTTHLFPVLNGLYSFYLVKADYDNARDVAGQMLELAAKTRVTEHTMVAHRAMGAVLLHVGEAKNARIHLEKSLELYDPEKHAKLAYVYGTDHASITSSFLSVAVWLSGEPDLALDIQESAVAAALEMDHAYSIAQALTYLCVLHLLRRNVAKTRETALRLETFAEEHAFAFMIKTAVVWRRWSDAYETPTADTLRLLHKAAEEYWSGGAGNYRPFFLTLIAEVALAAGRKETAQKLSEEALARLEKTNERWAQAETERIRALAMRDRDEAETRLLKAMHTAHSQSAIMFELRSAVSLLRMGNQEAVRLETGDSVRDLLKSIKGGHETEDIQSALSACEVICPAKTAPHRKGQEAAS